MEVTALRGEKRFERVRTELEAKVAEAERRALYWRKFAPPGEQERGPGFTVQEIRA